ncbi:MAG TPA: ATP-binding cassette domain-containing protein [Lentimicrobium sp.]|nr:ATP-binding cassette domain-containing protein [Lentimicrobium sp.]
MVIFSARNVTKRYANHTALTNVSIDIPRQSIFGLLGPNGAGKTSFIRIINQITAPDEGELFFSGQKLSPSHIGFIGYLPEERGLYKKMKVGEQALYLAQLKGVRKPDAMRKLKILFEKFEIQAWWNRKVEELSKGMQQKVQFIVTIIHEPDLLIFDEPFSGFDPINVNLLKGEILDLQRNGSTIIFSTHNMASVEELCDNIALINNSHKILDGKVKDIKNKYKTNTFSVMYANSAVALRSYLPLGAELISNEPTDYGSNAVVKLMKDTNPNELLSSLLPHISITGFNEIIPTMNEIFIETVKAAGEYVPEETTINVLKS